MTLWTTAAATAQCWAVLSERTVPTFQLYYLETFQGIFVKRNLTSFCLNRTLALSSEISSINNLCNNLVLSFGPDKNYYLLNAYLTQL